VIIRRYQRAALVLWLVSGVSFAAGDDSVYSREKLTQEKPRMESRIRELYSILTPYFSAAERGAFVNLDIRTPLTDRASFHIEGTVGRPAVVMPVSDLLFVEDLCTAYAWLDKRGYSMETVDEYIAMLKYKKPSDFPGRRYPPPLTALSIPVDAARDPLSGALGLRLRNSAYGFILAHELAHVVMRHPGYEGLPLEQARRNEADADRFALDVLQRVSEVPMGAVLFFLAQGYVTPNRGQFQAEGRSEREWKEFMQRDMTHPLAAYRMQSIALALDSAAGRERRPAERDTLRFISVRLAKMADDLDDVDLQQCMAVAAHRASPADLAPRRPGNARKFLEKCVKRE
jgi:hypothetical protein